MTDLALRDISWLLFYALVLGAWAALYLMALGSGAIAWGGPGALAEALATLCTGTGAGGAGLLGLWTMWAVMGAAMMLPTLLPMLSTYSGFAGRLQGGQAGWWGIVAGYALVWASFAVLAALVQAGLARVGLVDRFGAATAVWFQAGLLIVAGGYQLSKAKTHCQSACLSPMSYFMGRFRPGLAGGVRMGIEQGLWCVGCCWAIMALGFAGGVMNLAWMGLATLFMVLEKLPQIGARLRRPAGVILVLAGLALMAFEIGKAGAIWL
ncbi:DUF2182 domain-containing protein [Tropicibacter oceani]|uniref:DUF2182 domain-containing protein n=1 Tax=Tropicibacter oceani TaxID=3058420 RepID=A0ABY8QF05_9RHOB|nr:DUF2182 domain-containing protein [Tropicibacter oceani]WGW03180.1 DUF2182 domain-containing protein [Tropicibacter oceani]